MLLLSPDFLVPAINVPFPGTSPLNKPSVMTNIIEMFGIVPRHNMSVTINVRYLTRYMYLNNTAQYWLDWQFAVAQVFIDR